MWPFAKVETVEEPPAPPADYEAECLVRVRAAKAELDKIDGEMLAFRTRYKVRSDHFGRLLSIESATLTGYAAIKAAWEDLLRRRDAALAVWHPAVHEWSAARERARKEVT